ncbi:MAG: damage-inducible protein DinB [Lutibacter sp.]|nr:MAG: damage-inducible protein DinB [Lutibacter sp.]
MNSNQINENEYAPFYKNYITSLGDVYLLDILNDSLQELLATVKDLPEEKLVYRYAKGKWTIKELLQHIIDAERVLSYRALRFSRNDITDLHGFNEDWYVDNSNGNDRNFNELLHELTLIRKASISLFNSFSNEMLTMTGSANGSLMSVRALGFVIAGHQMHHLKIIKEKYL